MNTRPSTHLASVFQRTQNCSSRRSSKSKSNQYQTISFLAIISIHLLSLFGFCSFAFCFHTLIGGERGKGRPGRCEKSNDSVDDDDDDDDAVLVTIHIHPHTYTHKHPQGPLSQALSSRSCNGDRQLGHVGSINLLLHRCTQKVRQNL